MPVTHQEPARVSPDTAYVLERAWVDGEFRDEVLVEVLSGRFSRVETGGVSAVPATRLVGLTVPGLANVHSHVPHRALRGLQRGDRQAWRWRLDQVVERLDPDSMFELARATYREMAAAGFTTVGEFHDLHHQAGGTPYEDPNLMGVVLAEAAADAGIRLTLLDACRLGTGDEELPAQALRSTDADPERWALRVGALEKTLAGSEHARVGAALPTVRAMPRDQLPVFARAAEDRALQVHLCATQDEDTECRARYGVSAARLLADAGLLGPRTAAVHATHLDDWDVALLGSTGTRVALCPTTDRDLGHGVGPARRLHEAGARLTLGSGSHAVIDPFEEMRAAELHARLVSRRRGHWSAAELLTAATREGHDALGWPDAGQIAVGRRADLVTLTARSVRTAGTGGDEQTVVFAATAADVTHVVVDGWVLAREAEHVGADLDAVVARLLR